MEIRGTITTTVLILALIAISTTTAAALPCDCGDICVNETGWWNDDGAFNASTTPIQAAVDAASGGDVICVAAGSYSENVDITTAHLTLAGADADAVTVTAAISHDSVFYVTANYVNITGFTVTGITRGSSGLGAIRLGNADHCNISDNTVGNRYGISLLRSDSNTVMYNTVSNNAIHGLILNSADDNNIICNWVHNNALRGIILSKSTGNTIERNNIIANGNYNATSGGYEGQFFNYPSNDVDTAGNWWGTNNEAEINASIRDWTYNTAWGNVTTSPKLDGAVPCAPIPELPTVLLLAVGLLMLVGYVRIRRKT